MTHIPTDDPTCGAKSSIISATMANVLQEVSANETNEKIKLEIKKENDEEPHCPPLKNTMMSVEVKEEADFEVEQEKATEVEQQQGLETYISLNTDERERQYHRLKFLLSKSNDYTSYVFGRMKRQAEEDEKKKQRLAKKKETKAAPVVEVEKRTGLRNTGASSEPLERKRKASPKQAPKTKRRRTVKQEEPEPEEEDAENDVQIQQEPSDVKVEAKAEHPILFSGGSLRKYQIEGYKWLTCLYENGINCILADEMGLGKTIQCIAAIGELCAHGVPGPFLVVAPLSTIPNWVSEFQRFAPKIPVILYHGTKDERLLLRRKMIKKYEVLPDIFVRPVVVTSYEVTMNDRSFLQNMGWKYLIVDEGHRLKNAHCRLIRELKMITSTHRLLLTGTPLQNNLAELWALLNFILPEIFDDLGSFQMWFDASSLNSKETHAAIIEEEKRKNVLSMLHQILSPFLLRRVKSDVELNLPPKREQLVFAPLSEKQATMYRAAINDNIERLVKKEQFKKEEQSVKGRGCRERKSIDYSAMMENESELSNAEDEKDILSWCESVLDDGPKTAVKEKAVVQTGTDIHLQLRNKMMLLRKICNHPYLIEYPLTKDGEFKVDEKLISCCGKLKLFDQMVQELRKRGHKILVFSQMTSVLDILHDYCYFRGFEFSRLDGSMGVADRKVQMDKFNTDPDVGIFLLSTRAGGLGINLVAADTCIIYDSDWNPQADLQAQDRCHRIGQSKPVLIFRLVTAKTIDQEIVDRASFKRKLEKMVIIKGRFKNGMENFSTKAPVLNAEFLQELLASKDHDGQLEVSSSEKVLSKGNLNKLLDRSPLMEVWEASKRGEVVKPKAAASSSAEEGVAGVFKVIPEKMDEDEKMGSVKS